MPVGPVPPGFFQVFRKIMITGILGQKILCNIVYKVSRKGPVLNNVSLFGAILGVNFLTEVNRWKEQISQTNKYFTYEVVQRNSSRIRNGASLRVEAENA